MACLIKVGKRISVLLVIWHTVGNHIVYLMALGMRFARITLIELMKILWIRTNRI